MRQSLLLLLTILLIGCGDPRSAPARSTIPLAPRGPFSLRIEAPGVPGEPAPIRIEGDRAGVTVRIRRADAPLELYESWFVPVSPLTPPPSWEDGVTLTLDGETEPDWPELDAGLHLVTAIRGDERKMGLLPITDLDLIIRRSDDEVLVFVVDSRTGTARPGARVSIIGTDERRTGRADAGGVFRAAVRPGPEIQVIAFSGDRIGVGSSSRILGQEDDDLSILETDRKSCAPGNEVAFAGVVRVRANGRIRPFSGEDGQYQVLAAGDRVLSEGAVKLGPASTFRHAFYVPRTVGDGPITLRVTFGDLVLVRALKVRRPFPVPVTVEIVPDSYEPELGSRFHFLIRAMLSDGTVLKHADMGYTVTCDGRGGVIGGGTGVIRTSVVLEKKGVYEIAAWVTGPDGQVRRTSLRFGVHPDEDGIRIIPDSRLLGPDETAVARIIARGGGPIEGNLRIGEESHPFRIGVRENETSVRFGPRASGRHALSVTAENPDGKQLRATEQVWVLDDFGQSEVDEITLVADRDEIREGESMRLLLLLPAGLSGCSILETIEGRALGLHRASTRFKPQSILHFQAPERLGDLAHFRVYGSRAGVLHTAELPLQIEKSRESLVVATSSASRTGVRVRVTDLRGEHVPSVVLFGTVDGTGVAGKPGALSPWLRTGPDGQTEAWVPFPGSPDTVSALAVGLDGRVGRLVVRLTGNEVAAAAAEEPKRSSWADAELLESLDLTLPVGASEHWVVLPEHASLSAIQFRVDLNATTRSKLFPTLTSLRQRPAGSTLRTLIPLLEFAAAGAYTEAGLEVPPNLAGDTDTATHILADLLHLRHPDGGWGHFAGDAPDPRLTSLVERTIHATGLQEEVHLTAATRDPHERSDPATALDLAEECYDLLAAIKAIPPEETSEILVRVRVNNAIVGSVRLGHGVPRREHGYLMVPTTCLRQGNNLVQFDVAGEPGLTATITISRPASIASRGGPLSMTRTFKPRGQVRRGARLIAKIELTTGSPLRRVLVQCPIPAGTKLAAWPDLPEGVSFEERAGGIHLFVRELTGAMSIELPLVVLEKGTFEVEPARAVLLEQPDIRAQSKGAKLVFR